MLVVIRGAGDIATGIALRLWRAGIRVAMTDLEKGRKLCLSLFLPALHQTLCNLFLMVADLLRFSPYVV